MSLPERGILPGRRPIASGTPNAGDLFTLTPARTRSVFNTIAAAARLLRAPAASAADKAQLQSGLAQLTAGIDRSFEAVLAARTGAGAGLRELDTLGAANGGAALALQSELSDTENKIAASRRFFNNTVSEYNSSRESFPAVLFAASFGFHPETFFNLDDAERKATAAPPSVKF